MSPDRRISALKQLIKANARHNLTATSPQKTPVAGVRIPALDLEMPAQADIARQLTDLTQTIALRIQERIENMLLAVQHSLCAAYLSTCQKLLVSTSPSRISELLDRTRKTHEDIWNQRSSEIVDEKLPLMVARHGPIAVEEKKMPFNTLFVPVLERYFEQNAFPSVGVKQLLARKSGMELRQIDVWFQNRRTRSRKQGISLRRYVGFIDIDCLCKDVLGTVASPMRPVAPHVKRSRTSSREFKRLPKRQTTPQPSPLDGIATPSHAFPAAYPPKCDASPFPAKFTSAPVLFRTLSAHRPPSEPVDMDELGSLFGALVLGSPSGSSQPIQYRPDAWYMAKTIVPSPSPLPALVKPTHGPVPTPALSPSPARPSRKRARSPDSPSPDASSSKKSRVNSGLGGRASFPPARPVQSHPRASSTSSISSASSVNALGTPQSSPRGMRSTHLSHVFGVDEPLSVLVRSLPLPCSSLSLSLDSSLLKVFDRYASLPLSFSEKPLLSFVQQYILPPATS